MTTEPQPKELLTEDEWERRWFQRAVRDYRPGPLRTYREIRELGEHLRADRKLLE
jgi:hypothetical protein